MESLELTKFFDKFLINFKFNLTIHLHSYSGISFNIYFFLSHFFTFQLKLENNDRMVCFS